MRIRTVKVKATDTTGSRIRAQVVSTGPEITRGYDYGSNRPHYDVALELARRLHGPSVDVSIKETAHQPGGYTFTVETAERFASDDPKVKEYREAASKL
jgi:hypothetical protein